MKRITALLLVVLLTAALAAACRTESEPKPAEQPAATEAPVQPTETEAPAAPAEPEQAEAKIDLPDGVYTADNVKDFTLKFLSDELYECYTRRMIEYYTGVNK